MGKEAADAETAHANEMKRQREARGRMVNGLLALAAFVLAAWLVVGAIAGSVALLRLVF